MYKFLKKPYRLITRSRAYEVLLRASDRVSAALEAVTSRSPQTGDAVMIYTPAGDGNIGDHAMLNAHLRLLNRDVIVVSAGKSSRIASELSVRDVEIVPLRASYLFPPIFRIGAVFKFARLLRRCSAVYIHGADTMDGSNASASLARMSLLDIAQRRGLETGVLGFSWSEKAPAVVVNRMRKVSQGTKLFPRDPAGAERLEKRGIRVERQVADMAFSFPTRSALPPSVEAWLNGAQKFIILNTSGLIAKQMDQQPEFGTIIEQARSQGASVVFLPHVIREADDDLVIARAAFSRFGSQEDLLVEELLTPGQVQSLTARATAVVTGRMHLSILSLSQGTPAIALSTAGKVVGLFRNFGLEELVVEPRVGYGDAVAETLAQVLADTPQYRRSVVDALGRVREMSFANFETIEGIDDRLLVTGRVAAASAVE